MNDSQDRYTEPGLRQCPNCEGSGRTALGEHFVSHEMALDACEPEMEGMSMGIEYGACSECNGDGWICEVAPESG